MNLECEQGRFASPDINGKRRMLGGGGCSGADEQPGAVDVAQFGGGLANAEAKSEFSVELGVREEEIAALIETIHEGLVDSVAGAMAETDEIQRSGRGEFKLFIFTDPGSELLGEFDVAADVMLQTFDAVVANHKP